MDKSIELSASQLRADIYRVLDRVAEEGLEVLVLRKGHRIRIVCERPHDRLATLVPHPDYLCGDYDDLVHIDWSSEWRPD